MAPTEPTSLALISYPTHPSAVSENPRCAAEAQVISRTTGGPITGSRLVTDLRALGVTPGMTLLVHSSLSSLGWVVDGAETVVLALEQALGSTGTLMMPAYSYDAPEPSEWENPPVPESWWATIREEWPPYDGRWARSQHLGVIAETFRTQPGTLRSPHPSLSFSARGPQAPTLVGNHSLENAAGDGSPLARLYDLGGYVLLLGVGHDSNSSLHLSETRAHWPGREEMRSRKGKWVREGRMEEFLLLDFNWHSEEFGSLGKDLESETRSVSIGPVGMSESRLMPQRTLVDFGVRWIEHHRNKVPDPPSA